MTQLTSLELITLQRLVESAKTNDIGARMSLDQYTKDIAIKYKFNRQTSHVNLETGKITTNLRELYSERNNLEKQKYRLYQQNQNATHVQKRIDEIDKIIDPQVQAKLVELDYNCDVCGRDWYSTTIDKNSQIRVLCDYHFDNIVY